MVHVPWSFRPPSRHCSIGAPREKEAPFRKTPLWSCLPSRIPGQLKPFTNRSVRVLDFERFAFRVGFPLFLEGKFLWGFAFFRAHGLTSLDEKKTRLRCSPGLAGKAPGSPFLAFFCEGDFSPVRGLSLFFSF